MAAYTQSQLNDVAEKLNTRPRKRCTDRLNPPQLLLGGITQADDSDRPDATIPSRPHRLIALKTWEFSERLRELTADASEIALGPDGSVYLLSQESSVLIRLQKVLKSDEDKVSLDRGAYWKLPAGPKKSGRLSDRRQYASVDRHRY